MWTGNFKRQAKQSLSGTRTGALHETRHDVLERARRERAERASGRRREEAALVVQKVWRSYASRRDVRVRWMGAWRRRLADGLSAAGFFRELIGGVDVDAWEDVVELSRGLEMLEMLETGSPGTIGSLSELVVRDLFQLSVRCLGVHARGRRARFGCLRGVTWGELVADRGGSGERSVARVLVGFAMKVLAKRDRSTAWFGVSLQAVCLREVGWASRAGGSEGSEGSEGAGCVWVRRAGGRVVRDVVDVLGGGDDQLDGQWDGQQSKPGCVGEMMLTGVLVSLFTSPTPLESSESSESSGLDVLRVAMGVPGLFVRCPSVVPLAGKIWAAAVGCVGEVLSEGRGRAWREPRCDDPRAILTRQVVPVGSMEPLLVNLVQCLELMHGQGRLLGRPDGQCDDRDLELLFSFMALVDLVLDDAASWAVTPESFAHPLAEANVVVVMATAVLSRGRVLIAGQETAHGDDGGDRQSRVSTLCRFVQRLVGFAGSATVQTKILLTLAVKGNLAGLLWQAWLKELSAEYARGVSASSLSLDVLPVVVLFCEMFAMSLNVLGDEGFYDRGLPVATSDVYGGVQQQGVGPQQQQQTSVLGLLKALLWRVVWHENAHSELSLRFLKSGGKLLTLLHERNGRRPFAPQDAFYATSLPGESFHAAAVAAIGRGDMDKMLMEISDDPGDGDSFDDMDDMDDMNDTMDDDHARRHRMDVDGPDNSATETDTGTAAAATRAPSGKRVVDLLQFAYPLVPFLERVRVFQSIIEAERATIVDRESMSGVFFGGMSRERFVTVQRGRVLEDAYAVIGQRKSGVDVKKRIRISFVNEFGEQEAGIDGGGVFKEFLESVVRESVAADKGLFLSTTDNKLYPAPTASLTREQLNLIEFVGMMIGKALWEGILLELPLASFFLKKIRGAPTGVDDLPSLDPEMAKNLSYLARNPDSVADMGLTFAVSTDERGNDVELVPGGSRIPVTADNVAHFIHRVASFKLNEQIQTSCESFLSGFHAIVPKEWVRSFNDSELQMLVAGAEKKMDLDDLRRNVVYTGGYDAHHQTIVNLWPVLGGMTSGELADFLRFVTSCPRPPILGFASLQPPLTIQMVALANTSEAEERLPTAATCVNLLKLPAYTSLETLKVKLLYAIKSGAGFDLS